MHRDRSGGNLQISREPVFHSVRAEKKRHVIITHGGAGDVDPHVPMSQDGFWGLFQVPSGGPDDERGRVLGGEHGLGIL